MPFDRKSCPWCYAEKNPTHCIDDWGDGKYWCKRHLKTHKEYFKVARDFLPDGMLRRDQPTREERREVRRIVVSRDRLGPGRGSFHKELLLVYFIAFLLLLAILWYVSLTTGLVLQFTLNCNSF